MKKTIAVVLLAALCVTLLTGCLPWMLFSSFESFDEGESSNETVTRDFEAREWLKNNRDFTDNLKVRRFNSNQELADFVERLYEAGAARVYVQDYDLESRRPGKMQSAYPDTLYADMPSVSAKRKELLGIYDDEVRNYGCNYGEPASGWIDDTLSFCWMDDEDFEDYED